jgi:beta-glucanase (GH16 family)
LITPLYTVFGRVKRLLALSGSGYSADECRARVVPGAHLDWSSMHTHHGTLRRVAAVLLLAAAPAMAAAGATLLDEKFAGVPVDPRNWEIPTFKASGDGTFIGRTQFRVTQDSGLPKTDTHGAMIPIETYNGKEASFLGTEMISRNAFAVGKGLDVKIRAKMNSAAHPGIVGGIFLYALKPGSDTIHDEIDFELLTNRPGEVQTNIYAHEELGVGHVIFVPYPTGSMADYHDYEIKWTAKSVSWSIDGKLVRTTTENVPTEPMKFYFNIWAPDAHWPGGFNAAIQPVTSAGANTVLDYLSVESIGIRPMEP